MTKGIDISRYQGNIDWTKVKESGIEFVIIRIGSTTSGTILNKDSMFEINYTGARNAGLPVGVYYYSQATTAALAEAEAEWVLKLLNSRDLQLPIFMDIEDARHKSVGKTNLANVYQAFADTIEDNSNYVSKCYTGLYFLRSYIDGDKLYERSGQFWMAQYNNKMTYEKPEQVAIWQYSSTGSVSGITGNVDMNQSYVNVLEMTGIKMKNEWIKENGKWWYRHADGSYTKNNWEKIDEKWYYFDKDGWMATGWIRDKGKWYYLDASGAMVANMLYKVEQELYAFAEDGHMLESNDRGALL